MKTKYLLMIFDEDNTLLGYTSYLFNTQKQAKKYVKLLDSTGRKNVLAPLRVLDTKEINNEIKKFSQLVGQ
jgi:hypothetical protein